MQLKPVTPTAKAPAANFTGDVYVNPIYRGEDPSRMIVSLVRFTPGARTNWHSHAVGQTLHVTDGTGLVVTRDGTVIRMRPGDTVYTPPCEEHWHGATDGNFMGHLAMLEGTGDGDGTTWLEPVTDEEYQLANKRRPGPRRGELADVGLLGHVAEAPVDAPDVAVLMAEDKLLSCQAAPACSRPMTWSSCGLLAR